MTKLRLSDHNLLIETGRHKKIPKNKRFCPFCPQKVEDEIHLMVECTCYLYLRQITWQRVTDNIPKYRYLNTLQKFIFILTRDDLLETVAKFIEMAFELRSFLLTQPKRSN